MSRKAPLKIGLRFSDTEQFGRFCVALREDGVPFTLAGFQTVVLPAAEVNKLPNDPQKILKDAAAHHRVKRIPFLRGKGPRLISQERTEELLWQFAKAQ